MTIRNIIIILQHLSFDVRVLRGRRFGIIQHIRSFISMTMQTEGNKPRGRYYSPFFHFFGLYT